MTGLVAGGRVQGATTEEQPGSEEGRTRLRQAPFSGARAAAGQQHPDMLNRCQGRVPFKRDHRRIREVQRNS